MRMAHAIGTGINDHDPTDVNRNHVSEDKPGNINLRNSGIQNKTLTSKMSFVGRLMCELSFRRPSEALNTCGLMILNGNLDLDSFKKKANERITCFQRFRCVVNSTNVYSSIPFKDAGSDYDVSQNIKVVDVSNLSEGDDLSNYATEVLQKPFKEGIPPWEIHILENYQITKTAILGRFDHSLGDGFTIVQFILSLTKNEGGSSPDMFASPASTVLNKHNSKPGSDFFKLLLKLCTWIWSGLLFFFNFPMIFTNLNFGATLSDTKSALCPRGLRKGLKKLHFSKAVPLEVLKEIGRENGGAKVNDVVMTLITGASRRYLEARNFDVTPAMKTHITCTYSVRKPTKLSSDCVVGNENFGNQAASLYIPVPLSEKDPFKRLKCIKKTMDRFKNSPIGVVFPFHLWLTQALLKNSQKARDEMEELLCGEHYRTWHKTQFLSNIVGPPETLTLNGHEVESIRGMVAVPNSVVVISYASQIYFAYCADSYHVPDGEYWIELLEDELGKMQQRCF